MKALIEKIDRLLTSHLFGGELTICECNRCFELKDIRTSIIAEQERIIRAMEGIAAIDVHSNSTAKDLDLDEAIAIIKGRRT